ncbi:lactoferrin/transferrin family TonB-dependent receptor [Mannheimia varigena]|uniref:lactoferrin/transferrin family TonB-dependent receptor n=1 Tax=Mannheimia varigena TaxID=85404 RepID=UPI00110580D3|nr:lactoferrin/transferrin family TonB-dependent receptor [Mannheimia varigena]
MKYHHFHYSTIASAVLFALFHSYSAATENEKMTENSDMAVLDEVIVTESRYAHERQNEVTGLGKVVKNYSEMSKNQILGIRDLTRYDPGISVVEQGRGASSGYAIRGVDKNRVAMLVDGLPQAQHYNTLGSSANGGAINEIEYENIRSIELSKGASSAEYGSGALGGAISFRSKDAQDVIKDGQQWGLDTKTAYTSKNSHFLQSIAAAGEANGFEALVIATHRNGKETKVHSEANKLHHNIQRITGFENRYDLYPGSAQNTPGGSFFIVEDACPTLDCTPRASVKLNRDNFPFRKAPEYTSEERKQIEQIPYRTEQLSAKEYTGKERIAPNPLDYKSNSVFVKLGYHFNSSHYLGAVLEDTKQRYDIRDMQTPAYYTKDDVNIKLDNLWSKNPVYEGNNILDGLVFDRSIPYGLRYSRVKFFDEHHHKRRLGFNYQYKPENNRWLDSIKLIADKQNIELYSRMHRLHCSDYPNVDKNCRPSLDKAWSMYQTERNNYQEKHRLIRLEFDKAFTAGQGIFKQTHKMNFSLGFDRFNSLMNHGDMYAQYTKGGYINIRGRGRLDDPYIYRHLPRSIETVSLCDNKHGGILNCEPRKIKGDSRFVSFRDLITSEYVDLGLGVRFDQHRFKSDDLWTLSRTYRNWSWNGGITLKPSDFIALSYRISNGFRVPAFYELYGKRTHIGLIDNEYVQNEQRNHRLEPEKSMNHEMGVSFKGQFGYIDVSYFRNNYRNMIATACKKLTHKKSECFYNYHNIQDVVLNGVNLIAKFDLHGILSLIPDGFYSSVAYNRVKVKDRKLTDQRLTSVNDPILDAIQPARYVFGFGYDHPEEKWGIGITTTYSRAKKAEEVSGTRHHGIHRVDLGGKLTNSWYTHDITGYLNYKNYTLRGGIYNVTNRKYSTWESVRQSSVNAVNQDQGSNYTRFAAPGRNFSLAFEMKF